MRMGTGRRIDLALDSGDDILEEEIVIWGRFS